MKPKSQRTTIFIFRLEKRIRSRNTFVNVLNVFIKNVIGILQNKFNSGYSIVMINIFK